MSGRMSFPARTAIGTVGYLALLLVAACGGGSGGSSSSGPVVVPNTLQVTIDAGPTALTSQNMATANTLFATVTFCTPGSTTACQTIDHVQVDTGSVGLEIVAEALNGTASPTPIQDPATSGPLRECVQFADGYTWGSMVRADVTIGGRTISSLPVHLIGDQAAGSAPADCVSGPAENTVLAFGANGVLGIGNWLQDCGQACAASIIPKTYYACPAQTCTATAVALQNQLQNPVAMFSSDNNGVVIQLPAVTPPGAATLTGTVYFGIGTQSNNGLGSAVLLGLDGYGDLVTVYNGAMLASSFIDSGSNGYFFNSSIQACTDQIATGFYCPASSTAQSATIGSAGTAGTARGINFTVDNADTLFAVNATAYPDLAGPNNALNGQNNSFDWGLPFFFGRTVYVLIEGNSVSGTTGPAVGF